MVILRQQMRSKPERFAVSEKRIVTFPRLRATRLGAFTSASVALGLAA